MNVIAPEGPSRIESRSEPLRMSFEEWVAWDYEGGLTEWIDGEVKIYMSATRAHQGIVEFLLALLRLYTQLTGVGIIKTAPYAMRVTAGGSGREPDLMFVATAHQARVTDAFLDGPADLVVEVVSDGSVSEDRDIKFSEYEQGGVCEYWIIDPRPNRLRADFYVLDADGRYQPVPIPADRIYRAAVIPNFWLKVDWLWDEQMNPLTALSEILGADRLIEFLRAPHNAGA